MPFRRHSTNDSLSCVGSRTPNKVILKIKKLCWVPDREHSTKILHLILSRARDPIVLHPKRPHSPLSTRTRAAARPHVVARRRWVKPPLPHPRSVRHRPQLRPPRSSSPTPPPHPWHRRQPYHQPHAPVDSLMHFYFYWNHCVWHFKYMIVNSLAIASIW